MSSRPQRDEALEKEDRKDEMKKIKNSPPLPHLLQAQQAPVLPYAKVVGRHGTGRYAAACYLTRYNDLFALSLNILL